MEQRPVAVGEARARDRRNGSVQTGTAHSDAPARPRHETSTSPARRRTTPTAHTAAPPRRSGGVRTPELVLGVMLVAGAALGGLLWARTVTATSPVVVAATSIGRGEVITAEHLRAADVAVDGTIALVPGADAASLLGTVALVDLAPGTPITPDVVSDAPLLGADEALVSVALDPGDAPPSLAPGDTVRVVLVRADDPTVPVETELLDLTAEVWEVLPASEYDPSTVITLRLPLDRAATVAGDPSVRLVRTES